MEQILLYIVTISGFSGLMLGMYSLLVPALQRRGIRVPFTGRADSNDATFDYEDDDEDALQFAANSFSARRGSLLQRLPRKRDRDEPEEEDYDGADPGEELLGDLDLSRELAEVRAEDDDVDDEDEQADELAALTFEAEVDPVLEELIKDDDLEEEDDEDGDEYEDEDEDEEGEDEEEAEPQAPVIHVVSAGGEGNDMMALFGEGQDVFKEIETWRADLPDPTISELLAEAREINAMLKSRRSRA